MLEQAGGSVLTPLVPCKRSASAPAPANGSVALCLVAKDENPTDLDEWLEYHRRLGVSKVYLFDHNSSTPAFESPAVMRHIKAGFLQCEHRQFTRFLHPLSFEERYPQTTNLRDKHTWVGFIDVGQDLPTFLGHYEAYGGLSLNWRLFSSSGHVRRPEGGVLANYWRWPLRVAEQGVHSASFVPPFYSVDEAFRQVVGGHTSTWAGSRIVLNHYVTKSREDMEAKVARGCVMRQSGKTWDYFGHVEREAADVCTDGLDAAANQTAAALARARIERLRVEPCTHYAEGAVVQCGGDIFLAANGTLRQFSPDGYAAVGKPKPARDCAGTMCKRGLPINAAAAPQALALLTAAPWVSAPAQGPPTTTPGISSAAPGGGALPQ
eukprot:scaffold6.g2866.t1